MTYFQVLNEAENASYYHLKEMLRVFHIYSLARQVKNRFQESTHTVDDIARLITEEYSLPKLTN